MVHRRLVYIYLLNMPSFSSRYFNKIKRASRLGRLLALSLEILKQSNQLSLPHQDDCNTKMDTKQRTTKHRTITDSHNGSNNKQKVNNNRTTALERTAAQATGGGGGAKCTLLAPNPHPRLHRCRST